ncbi:MAG: hypothetical protein QMD23_05275 [Candidatus Bathyarchaeia archaeon]|nr:hypothetical protein [Candidatus Bathyarchaeia archaeon]
MVERDLLMIPGPTSVDPAVLRFLSKPTLSHTDSEFVKIFKEVPWGKSIKPDKIKDALKEDDYKAVTVTHVETSTG